MSTGSRLPSSNHQSICQAVSIPRPHLGATRSMPPSLSYSTTCRSIAIAAEDGEGADDPAALLLISLHLGDADANKTPHVAIPIGWMDVLFTACSDSFLLRTCMATGRIAILGSRPVDGQIGSLFTCSCGVRLAISRAAIDDSHTEVTKTNVIRGVGAQRSKLSLSLFFSVSLKSDTSGKRLFLFTYAAYPSLIQFRCLDACEP